MFSCLWILRKSHKISSFLTLSPPLMSSKTETSFPLELGNSFFRENVQLLVNIEKVSENHQLPHIESTSDELKNWNFVPFRVREFVLLEKCSVDRKYRESLRKSPASRRWVHLWWFHKYFLALRQGEDNWGKTNWSKI